MSDLRTLLQAGTGDSELIIKSNITPEIRVKLSDLLVPGKTARQAMTSDSPVMMRLIKPEIIIQTLGIERPYSPYGRPQAGMYSTVLMGFAASGVVGAIITLLVCKNYF